MAAATASAAATAPACESPRRARRSRSRRRKHRKLNRGLLARALRAADLLLFIDHNFLEALIALVTNVLVNGHVEKSPKTRRRGTDGAKINYTLGTSGHIPAAVDADGLPSNVVASRQHHRYPRDLLGAPKDSQGNARR